MCGIAGFLTKQGAESKLAARMIAPIAHRGPDGEGVWIDAEAGIGFGHRRLAIIDLSPQGHQPMHSADGRYVISYNAEIYNHADLRKDLEAAGAAPPGGWRGHSDTETFLECVSAWGLADTLPKIVGMFAFALWDRKERTLSLVRDRFGEKPLYYGWAGPDFVFASELKAIRAHPRFEGEIDRQALRLFAARTYIPAPFSIYKRLFKLDPGCVLTITPDGARTPLDAPPGVGSTAGGVSIRRYWSYRDVVRRGLADPIEQETEALALLEQVLAKAIQDQSVADVPVGAFLSGGIDSSTVVALYQKYSSRPVRTFTIGFEEAGFNEAEDAKAVAAHLGTVHSERYVTVKEAREVIPLLPRCTTSRSPIPRRSRPSWSVASVVRSIAPRAPRIVAAMAKDLLDSKAMAGEGWFDPAIVQRRWREHLSGQRDSTPALWALLMFQAWLREQKVSLREAA